MLSDDAVVQLRLVLRHHAGKARDKAQQYAGDNLASYWRGLADGLEFAELLLALDDRPEQKAGE